MSAALGWPKDQPRRTKNLLCNAECPYIVPYKKRRTMPCLKILTNLPKSAVPNDFVNKIIPVLSKTVNKPPENFICVVSSDCSLTFGGDSTNPGAVATLESIGNLGIKENKYITKEVSAFVEKELGIKQDRFFLTFYDLLNYNVAKGGVTIDMINPKK